MCQDKELIGSWNDVRDILNELLNLDFGESTYRKKFQAFQKMFKANESKFVDTEILSEIDLKKIELQKERQKFFDQRNAFNKTIRERSRQEELNEIIQDVISNGYLPSLNYTPNNILPSDNDLLVSLCDLHYGANVDNAWNYYNSDVCRERLCQYIDEIISIQKTHNSENCIVWANGDEINGNIHLEIAITNKENVIEQITGVSEVIANFLAELSKHFKKVSYISIAGNHSRIDTKDRALKDERLDDLIEWFLQARLQNFENIKIGDCQKIDTTIYLANIRGLNYVGVHGDYDGSDSKIQALQSFIRKPIYAVLLGHLHHNKLDTVQGIKTIMAGSFLGMDNFCITKRIYGEPQQLICVVTDKGIRCSYDINF